MRVCVLCVEVVAPSALLALLNPRMDICSTHIFEHTHTLHTLPHLTRLVAFNKSKKKRIHFDWDWKIVVLTIYICSHCIPENVHRLSSSLHKLYKCSLYGHSINRYIYRKPIHQLQSRKTNNLYHCTHVNHSTKKTPTLHNKKHLYAQFHTSSTINYISIT